MATQTALVKKPLTEAEKLKKKQDNEKAKTERFKEIAPKRTRIILKNIEVLTNCANKNGYTYTPEQVTKIFDTIQKKVNDAKAMFSATGGKATVTFSLD